MSPLIRRLLLVASLVFGQWLAVAHASEHHVLAQKHACSLCLHVQPLDAGAAAPALNLTLVAAEAAVLHLTAVAPEVVSRHHYRSRAPPTDLAD
ncbi:MAG: hypothetical protein AABY95_05830 [Pseudomonadota bacterium]